MKNVIAVLIVVFLAACQSTPNKKPLMTTYNTQLNQLDVKLAKSKGFSASYFKGDSSSIAVNGLIVGGIAAAINNAAAKKGKVSFGSIRLSRYGISSLNKNFNKDRLDKLVKTQLVTKNISEIAIIESFESSNIVKKDTLYLEFSYKMTPDFSSISVTAKAKILSPNTQYDNPYDEENIKEELGTPIYFNSFEYTSNYLDAPVKTTEEYKAQRRAVIEEYAPLLKKHKLGAKAGEVRTKKTKALRKIKKYYSEYELVNKYIEQWLANDAEKLIVEFNKAYDFTITSIIHDFSDRSIPSLEEGEDVILETHENRVLSKIGSGVDAGSYKLSPANERIYAVDAVLTTK